MYEKHYKINSYLFYTLLFIEIIIVVFLCFERHINILFQNDTLYTLNTDWNYLDKDGNDNIISLPANINASNDDRVSISHILPEEHYLSSHLSILSNHQNIEAYIDDELIYSRTNNLNHGPFDVPTIHVWDIIELPRGSEGKVITLIISSDYQNYAGKINEVYVGSKSALIIHNILTSGISLVIALITLMTGIITIITYLFLKRLLTINKSLLFLGFFILISSLWMLTESNLTQIFIANEYVISALTYLSLMTLPIPIIMYITYFDNLHYKKTIFNLSFIFLGTTFILILLQLFNLFDFHETSSFVRLEIFALLGLVLIVLMIDLIKYKNKELTAFTAASAVLFIFGIIELFTYQLRSSNTGVIFQIGFVIFIGILIADALKKVADIIKLSESAKHYKFLATRDLLTNCRNRVSYSRDMNRVSLDRNITIYIADMNNMKQINDTFGHHIGDEAIVLCSQCLLNVFGHRVYRIGGDEFAIIQYDLNPEKRDQLLGDFEVECEKTNLDNPYPFSMAIGYAIYDKDIDKTIFDTVKRADKDMYYRKEKTKSNVSDE